MTPTIATTDAFAQLAHVGMLDRAGVPYIAHPRMVL